MANATTRRRGARGQGERAMIAAIVKGSPKDGAGLA